MARELINDHNPYYQAVALHTPEAGDGFQRFVFGVVFDGALQRTAAARKRHLDELAANRFYLVPALGMVLESAPLERVNALPTSWRTARRHLRGALLAACALV